PAAGLRLGYRRIRLLATAATLFLEHDRKHADAMSPRLNRRKDKSPGHWRIALRLPLFEAREVSFPFRKNGCLLIAAASRFTESRADQNIVHRGPECIRQLQAHFPIADVLQK